MVGFSVICKSVLAGAFLITATLYCGGDTTSDNLITEPFTKTTRDNDYGMTIEEFKKKVAVSNKIILVYFHADWCMPCVKLKPEILEVENEVKEYCELLSIDTDANPKIAEYFEINSLPMFVIYKDGKKSWENVGLMTKKQIIAKVDVFKK